MTGPAETVPGTGGAVPSPAQEGTFKPVSVGRISEVIVDQIREHERFIEAVRRRDADAATKTVREHLGRTARRVGH